MEKGMRIVSVLAVAVLMFASMAVMLAPAAVGEEENAGYTINMSFIDNDILTFTSSEPSSQTFSANYDVSIVCTSGDGTVRLYFNEVPLTIKTSFGAKYTVKAGATFNSVTVNVDGTDYAVEIGNSKQVTTISGGGTHNVSLKGNGTVEATYNISTIVNPSGSGSASATPSSVKSGGSSTLSAAAVSGYEFDHWSENGMTVSTSSTYTVSNITSNRTFTAHFRAVTPTTYTITFTTDGNGSVSVPAITGLSSGTEITVVDNKVTIGSTTVTATPSSGYEFDRWENAPGTVTGNMKITAHFRSASTTTYTVSFTTDGHGSVDPGSMTVSEGSSITVSGNTVTIGDKTATATASSEYKFKEWTINGQPIAKGTTITSDVTIKANFEVIEEDECKITFKAEKGGNVSQTEMTVKKGSVFTVTDNNITIGSEKIVAIAGTGYSFDKWSVSTGDKANEDMTVTAYFKADTPGPDPPTPPEPEKKEPIYLYGFIGFTVGTVALIGAALFGVRHPIIYIVAAVFAIVAAVLALMYFGVIKL